MSMDSWVARAAAVGAAARALRRGGAGPAGDPAVEVHQAEQPGPGAGQHHHAVGHRGPVVVAAQRLVGGLPRVRQHVPEQEHQNPDRGTVEERLHLRRHRVHPAERQAKEDGQAGDGAQERDLAR
jgi:hypothetical protein